MNAIRIMLFALSAILFLQCSNDNNEASKKFVKQYSKKIDSLVVQEKAFAKASQKNGIKAAFLQYLTEDAIIFRPAPMNGVEIYNEYDDTGKSLRWYPTYADVAISDDIGFTTGPWVFSYNPENDTINIYGHYFSVWKRQENGDWRVIFDAGISHDSTKNFNGVQIYPIYIADLENPNNITNTDIEANDIVNLLKSVYFSAVDDDANLFGKLSTDSLFIYNDNELPIIGTKEGMDYLASLRTTPEWYVISTTISEANDFVFVYGVTEGKSNNEETYHSFAAILRNFPNEGLKVVGMLFNEINEELFTHYL